MKLADIRENYYEFSRKTSEVVRNLGFAGIALIWVFRTEINGSLIIHPDLYLAGVFLVIGLGLDLLHCVIPTALWGGYQRLLENKGTDEAAEVLPSRMINWPGNLCFWGKIIFIMVAYIILTSFMLNKIN